MIKTLVIAPYEGLLELIKETAKEIDGIEIDMEVGNLYEGIELAKKAEKSGYDVIISRGGTASMIEEAVSIPVINIQVSGYDMLRILTLAKGFAGKAAIIGFPNITQGAAMITSLLDIDVKMITLKRDINVKEKLMSLKELGYEVVVGDVVTIEAAKELGLNGVLITSGREAIIEAIEEARRVHRIFSQLKKDVLFYQSVLNTDQRLIAVIDKNKKLLYSNESFNKQAHPSMLESEDMKEIIEDMFHAQSEQRKFLYHSGQMWKVRGGFAPNGTMVFYFEKEFRNELYENEENSNENAIRIQSTIPYAVINGKSKEVQTVLHQVKMYSQLDEPVWISGERGNGKELIAHSIYLNSKQGDKLLITVDCELLSKKQLESLINERFFQKNSHSILFLKGIDRLDTAVQKDLYYYLNSCTNEKLPRMIISSDETIEQKLRSGKFDKDLFYLLARLVIYISPLRERKEDIEYLVHVFISEAHLKYGKQVVGIREDAVEKLVEFEWPGNIEQLKQVVRQLVILSKSHYIESEEVDMLLKGINKSKANNVLNCNVDLNGTLTEIEKRIIEQVLEEEEMNQSKAAKRLGINRSTLWRKLK
jgi:transcriptional regulator with PAS, ATPase and Fis domain